MSYRSDIRSVFEIGGGYGAPARMWKLTAGVDRYAVADFPECLFFAEVFLRANFPDADLLYVREPADAARAGEADFVLCPIQHVESLKGIHFDLAVNTGSIQEMTEEWVDFWMDYLDAANVSLFYSLNYFAQPLELMAESKNTWSPRPHPRWAARLLRTEPYFVKTQTTRVYAETMYEKGDSADVEAANRAFELYDHRFFDVQCMLEQMDAVRVTRDAGQMWRLLERIMEELGWVPKEAYWLAEQLASNGAAGADRDRLSGYTKRLQLDPQGRKRGLRVGPPVSDRVGPPTGTACNVQLRRLRAASASGSGNRRRSDSPSSAPRRAGPRMRARARGLGEGHSRQAGSCGRTAGSRTAMPENAQFDSRPARSAALGRSWNPVTLPPCPMVATLFDPGRSWTRIVTSAARSSWRAARSLKSWSVTTSP